MHSTLIGTTSTIATAASTGYAPANGLAYGALDCITSEDFAALNRLAISYVELLGGDVDDLTQDAAFFLARSLNEGEPIDSYGGETFWLYNARTVSRDTLRRLAIDNAAAYQGLCLQDLHGDLRMPLLAA